MVQENFINTITSSLVNNWSKPAFTDYGTEHTMTYGDVANQIAKLHLIMREVGIKPTDRVALMGRNNSNWVTTYLATITYGAIVVPILQDFNSYDTLHIINHSGSKLLFLTDLLYDNLDIHQMSEVRAVISLTDFHPIATVPAVETENILPEAILKRFEALYPNGLQPDDIHYIHRSNEEVGSINYTSGTTGFSKGVLTPLNALAGNVKFCSENHVVYPESRQLVHLPLAHSFGCAFDFLTSFCVGAHAWYMGRMPSARILLQAFAEVKPTCVFTVPLIIEKLYKQIILPHKNDISPTKARQILIDLFGGQLDEVIIGGAPLNDEVAQYLTDIKFPYTVGYGMTECAPLIAYCKANVYRLGSCGKELPGLMKVKVDHPNKDGIGELIVSGEHIMYGYYEGSNESLNLRTTDEWFRTGDLGYIDEDGYIYIKGRCKTMILGPNGQNIYPEEIEAKLNNLPYVAESLVLEQEGRLVALVYPDLKAADDAHLNHEMLEQMMERNRKIVNARLARYEQIQRISLFPREFEKTPKKNIKRFLYTYALTK